MVVPSRRPVRCPSRVGAVRDESQHRVLRSPFVPVEGPKSSSCSPTGLAMVVPEGTIDHLSLVGLVHTPRIR
jgi:hypothetical protein